MYRLFDQLLISPGYRGGEPRVPPQNHWTLWWHHQQTPQRFEYLLEFYSTIQKILNNVQYVHWTERELLEFVDLGLSRLIRAFKKNRFNPDDGGRMENWGNEAKLS